MRGMFGLVLVAGVALAGSAVYVAKGYIGKTQTALEQERELRAKVGPVVEVYVAKAPKNYGEQLEAEDVQLVYWPKNSLPEGVFMTEAELFPKGPAKTRAVLRQIEKFEPIMISKVTEPGEPAGLTGQLAKGMRAFAIKIDDRSGVQSNVRPSDRIDIYWTGVADGSGTEITRLIESNTQVIATDQVGKDDQSVARTVTVAATPEQVGRLAQAQATGRLTFSLIGIGDVAVADGTTVIDNCDILGGCAEVAPAPVFEEAKICTIWMNKGGERVEVPVPCTN